MFTGIISGLGEVTSVIEKDGGRELIISCDDYFLDTRVGDSVAVNGVCLTVTSVEKSSMTTFAQIETVEQTTISEWAVGEKVNLETPLRVNDQLGGHLVQGHVDGIATISFVERLTDGSARVGVDIGNEHSKYIVHKGSICLNGVSLTVAKKEDRHIEVALIPETLEKTTFGKAFTGDKINIEVDVIARYVENMMPSSS
jgi:riboflavin synthase